MKKRLEKIFVRQDLIYSFFICFYGFFESFYVLVLFFVERPLSCVERDKNDIMQLVMLYGSEDL